MRIAIFAPFHTAAGHAMQLTWQNNWPLKEKYELTPRAGKPTHAPLFFSLKHIKQLAAFQNNEDTIYVVAHGAKNTQYIADVQDVNAPGARRVTPGELVIMFRDSLLLPLTFSGKIKILACASALQDIGSSFLNVFEQAARPHYPHAHFCGYLDVIFTEMKKAGAGDPVKEQGGQKMADKLSKRIGIPAYDRAKSYQPASYHREWRCPPGCPGHPRNYTLP